MQKKINRSGSSSTKIFDNRTLFKDYRTLVPLLKKGMRVMDIGCGTGSISLDIAKIISPKGSIIGIDNTKSFIEIGKERCAGFNNLELIHADLYDFEVAEKFDLIISARTFQWLSEVEKAFEKVKSLLKPGGVLSILDYDHTRIDWNPSPPESMQKFYNAFLKWREDAGMHNNMANILSNMFEKNGFENIKVLNADERHHKKDVDFKEEVGIWSKVAGLTQIAEEGYISESRRLLAIEEYNEWIDTEAISMTLKLNEVRGEML